jgi:hypothetical protein
MVGLKCFSPLFHHGDKCSWNKQQSSPALKVTPSAVSSSGIKNFKNLPRITITQFIEGPQLRLDSRQKHLGMTDFLGDPFYFSSLLRGSLRGDVEV